MEASGATQERPELPVRSAHAHARGEPSGRHLGTWGQVSRTRLVSPAFAQTSQLLRGKTQASAFRAEGVNFTPRKRGSTLG